jgi:hypothetical protein
VDDSERIYTRGPAAPVSSRVAGTAGRHVEFSWIPCCQVGTSFLAKRFMGAREQRVRLPSSEP